MNASYVIALIAIAALAGLAGFYSYTSTIEEQPTAARERTLPMQRPEFELADHEGVTRKFSEWDGKPLLVNFWATWCPPCRHEIPLLVQLQESYGVRGLQVIGIAVDEPVQVREYMAEAGINYPVLIGEQDALEAAAAFGIEVTGLPVSVLVGRDGTILERLTGELKPDLAESWLVRAGVSP